MNTGSILWYFGGPENQFIINPADTFAGQHAISRTGDMQILMLDNNGLDTLTRVIEFNADDYMLTADNIFEYVLPIEQKTFIIGIVYRLPNGNNLICSGLGSVITEINSQGEVLWTATQDEPLYRAYYLPALYDSLPASLVTGIEVSDLILNQLNIYPNPGSDQITIRYSLTRNSKIVLDLLDLSGRKVAFLYSGSQNQGNHSRVLVPADHGLTKGVYLLRFEIEGKSITKRIIIE